jgi:phage/plasmid-associated DNA primase
MTYAETAQLYVDARTAGAAPAPGPTPLWDAFCAAVWPDPEQRAWALRVLGIAVTGYADRAMPIFWGDRGRGKTQVLALVSDVLGNYAVAADPRLLGSGEHHGSVLLALAGSSSSPTSKL